MWQRIKQIMDEKGMTMYAVSKKAGINQNVLIDLKAGRSKRIYFDNMVKIADALDVSLDEFRKERNG
ncbi:helix-turn-helix domain-containing protein [Streptococcus sp. ZJ93]|uniref:helix-turn-helix domain-containing protein n=2 Tax=Streptococcus handemini TaxID=3161188 RepID=UPI0032F0927C